MVKKTSLVGSGREWGEIAGDKTNKVVHSKPVNQVEELGLYPISHEDPLKSSHNQTADFMLERTLWVQQRQ